MLGLATGCGSEPEARPASSVSHDAGADARPHAAELTALVAYEEAKRAGLDHAAVPPWSVRSGADPFALLAREGGGALGLLRSGRLVKLDAAGVILAGVDTLPGSTGVLVVGDEVLVVAEGDGRIDVLDAATLARRRRVVVPDVASIRAAAHGPEGTLYLADPHRHRVLALAWPSGEHARTLAECGGALDVRRVEGWLAWACVLDHTVVARPVDADGALGEAVVARHDGPVWSFDAAADSGGDLRLVLGGVEDRALDRSDGAFGWVDSFAFVYEVLAPTASAPPRLRAGAVTNLSELGIVTPKHVAWRPDGDGVHAAVVTGYGGDRAATLRWPEGLAHPPRASVHAVLPGITDLVGDFGAGLAADPLLDAWLVLDGGEVRVVPAVHGRDDRTASERLGEALAFTTLMSPHATAEGRKSRFTCETCHFEGRGDGRVHFTGRGQVHATTKTLRGLFANRPHFSRALDRTTAKMVHNEFAVASRGTGHDAWFTVRPSEQAAWLRHIGIVDDELDPVELRRALIDFLAAFTPEPNPAIRGRRELDAQEREGAQLFVAHCEACHAARLVSDAPDSRVAPHAWEALVLSPSGPIVWGRDARERTGVEPYVHPDGARVPSLRRLWVKRPYLTNGSARALDDVLTGVRLGGAPAHGGDEGRSLSLEERRALRAFLDLL